MVFQTLKHLDVYHKLDIHHQLLKFECFYFAAIWKNQKNVNNLKLLYQPIEIKEINRNNWDAIVHKIKYVTGEENRSYKISNVLNMWDSIQKTTDFLDKSTWALATLLLALILASNIAIGGSEAELESKALDPESTTTVPAEDLPAEAIPLTDEESN